MQGDNISQAIDAINKNEVVGIPTETVYGIGVNPNSKEAVEKSVSYTHLTLPTNREV